MNFFPCLACLILTLTLIAPSLGFTAGLDGADLAQAETIEEALELEIDEMEPEPQRMYCAHRWNDMYEGQKADIEVTTKGQYNEIAVFHCPDCSLREHFVDPFLESEYRGKTGMMRLSECGFSQAVFKGTRGTHEIVVDVPRVFPDPARLACIEDWSEEYREQNSIVQISSLGELNEVIVFTCLYCPSQKSFVAPFLLTVYNGKTAMDRMRECGFKKVVFTNPSGTRRIIREVR